MRSRKGVPSFRTRPAMNHDLIVALIQNAALLLAMAMVFDFLTSKQDVLATRLRQVLAGLAIGVIGIAMIDLGVPFEPEILFDTRSVLLAVSGLFLGALPTLIAIAMTAAFRLAVGGIGAWTGVSVIVASGAIGVAWRRVRRGRLDRIAASDLWGLGVVVHAVMLALLFTLPSPASARVVQGLALPLLLVYPLATLALGKLFSERLRSHRDRSSTVQLLAETEEARNALTRLVAEQHATERELLAAQRFAQSTLDALSQHLCVLDHAGEIIAVNDAWCEFAAANHARPKSVLAGANYLAVCDAVTGPEAGEALEFATGLRDVLAGWRSTFSMEYACHSPDRERWFTARVTRFASDGVPRVVVAHADITERKKAERERLELITQLHQSQKLESLGSLAGGVAHDINNVLAAILSAATAQRSQVAGAGPLAASLDTIINACVRGRSVVRSLLYFARTDIETRGPVDLNAIAREIVQLLGQTTLKRIRFGLELDPDLPTIQGDEAAISHALMNVCINAGDAMPDGGTIDVRTCRGASSVEIRVRDTGVGMTAEVKAKAIEPFFTTKGVGKGTGLGLAMVYGAVKAHGGSLDIDTAPGQGTEVVLTFPASPEPPAVEADRATHAHSPAQGGLRLMLVDDDELIRESVASLLEVEGHRVEVVESGPRALSRFAAGAEVDLVLLDMNMPEMNGAETLRRILELNPAQRVLMCSGHYDEEIARLAASRENVLAIQKPFTLDELEAKLAAFGLAVQSVERRG